MCSSQEIAIESPLADWEWYLLLRMIATHVCARGCDDYGIVVAEMLTTLASSESTKDL